jgi:hypothetical protein
MQHAFCVFWITAIMVYSNIHFLNHITRLCSGDFSRTLATPTSPACQTSSACFTYFKMVSFVLI